MKVLKLIVAVVVVSGATACVDSTPYGRGNGYAYSPAAYDYNQQPAYYRTQYANGQPTYDSRQTSSYGYGYRAQPVYYGYQQPAYYGR
ncbi:MAG TPA: hypothetical protein VE999_02180 [Gemmataceae bacterium]|jgi:hypothetical protein|nr:hypothetical protein [Gemmataceae bacterium]